MRRVTVIGSGNVAEALALAISESALELVEVAGRNVERLTAIATLTGCSVGSIETLLPADLYILAVSDGAVATLAKQITTPKGSIVTHCAGSVAMEYEGIDGVIYPMQSFTAGRRVNFREVPLFIEAREEQDMPIIREVAEALSESVMELSSEKRRQLHLGAVFACNFTNAMFSACSEVLASSGVGLEIYRPLVEETVAKAFAPDSTPQQAQTGAARRGDETTQRKHMEMLRESSSLSEIYNIISIYIWETSKRI